MELRKKVLSSLATLMLYDYDENKRMQRSAAATAYGLDKVEFAKPYTQHSAKTITYNGGGVWRGAAVALGAAALGAASFFLLAKHFKTEPTTPPKPVEKVIDNTKDFRFSDDVRYIPPPE